LTFEDDLDQVMSMIKRIKAKNALRRMREKASENNITEIWCWWRNCKRNNK